jgi:hypothetical protein
MEHHNSGESRYYLCDVCAVLLLGTDSIMSHLQRHHAVNPSSERLHKMRRFPCLLCLFPFKHSGHRVDHFRANHRMDIKAFYTRNLKKGQYVAQSPASASKHKKLNKPTFVIKEERLKKESYVVKEEKPKKIDKPEKRKLSAEVEETEVPEKSPKMSAGRPAKSARADDEVSVGSSTPSLKIASRRIGLKPELKDKYADILLNQPSVRCRDVVNDYYKGRYEYHTWYYFEKCIKKPKIMAAKK